MKNYIFSVFIKFILAALWLPVLLCSVNIQAQVYVEGGAVFYSADSATVTVVKDQSVPQKIARKENKTVSRKPIAKVISVKKVKDTPVAPVRSTEFILPNTSGGQFTSRVTAQVKAVLNTTHDSRTAAILPLVVFRILSFENELKTAVALRCGFSRLSYSQYFSVRPPPAVFS